MAEHSRYDVGGDEAASEGFFQNHLGITTQDELEDAEALLLSDSYSFFFDELQQGNIVFDVSLLFRIHRHFLGSLYSWAGKNRTVEISKGAVMFAASAYIEKSLVSFQETLKEHTPTRGDSLGKIAYKLAVIHCEFIAIHPFRDGNGRTIRLFLDLLASKWGYSPLRLGKIKQERYIQACKRGMVKDYEPMAEIIEKLLATKS